jgi:DNA polymerase-4
MSMTDYVNWLFLDLNAYFASVEQQIQPALRGKPVAVVPVMTDSTCCIAASYEAKAYGVKTGTNVGLAKELCPGIHLVEATHAFYVRYHDMIVKAVESCVPVTSVISIDEMTCHLTGSQREIPNAVALAQKIKQTLASRVGEYLLCSIGLGPNRYLAKVAGDMQKPNGLTTIRRQDLPHILYKLELTDLPGIGSHMEARLHQKRIFTMEQLCRLSGSQMRDIWGGIVGERFHAWLRGEEVNEPETHRSSIGHSHVLPPELRTMHGAFQVAQKLTHKAAIRLRKKSYWTKGLSLAVQFPGDARQSYGGGGWGVKTKLMETQDTPTLLKALDKLWSQVPSGKPLWIGVTLFPIVPLNQHMPSLFDNPKQEKLSLVMDQINDTYGRDTAYFAALHDAREKAPTRIAFTQIPDLSEVD